MQGLSLSTESLVRIFEQIGKWSEKVSVELKRLNKNKLSKSIRRSTKAGKGRGADNLYRGHFILNYIYNSKMALPSRSPWLPLKSLSGDQGTKNDAKLSVCLVSKLHNSGVQKLKL